MKHILLVDDEAGILGSLQRLLRAAPCTYGNRSFPLAVSAFLSPRQALESARGEHYDLVISDYRMPEMDGVEFLKEIKQILPDAVRFILSGYADLNALTRAVNEVGIERFLGKPWNDYELLSAIGQALAHQELARENRELANLMRVELGEATPEQIERQRLEAIEPGITHVNWGADGSVILDPEFRDKD